MFKCDGWVKLLVIFTFVLAIAFVSTLVVLARTARWNAEMTLPDGQTWRGMKKYNFGGEEMMVGRWLAFRRDGSIISESFYEKGVLQGIQIFYFPAGNIQYIISWRNGVRDGPFLEMDGAGEFVQSGTYEKGVLVPKSIVHPPVAESRTAYQEDIATKNDMAIKDTLSGFK